ncbi:hypothetical protein BpHYR1_013899 [Brachionus plicatilis]|uniref:Uncharacterized protein n=1 Tax=Brachionus plicatilis TaxID=10195 RepID=A0A3M7RJZ0_BRAPC|nr:hypothetical protein BpHYR1_013899 [Brachionus plicatilis]
MHWAGIFEIKFLILYCRFFDIVKFNYKLNKNSFFFDELKLKQKKVQQSILHIVAEEFLFNLYLNFTIPDFSVNIKVVFNYRSPHFMSRIT